MKTSTSRIITSHVGSLARPHRLLDLMKADGGATDNPALQSELRAAVADAVRRQAEAGIDVVNDGEMSKPNFVTYARNRMNGVEETTPPARAPRLRGSRAEREAFPAYYEMYERARAARGYAVPFPEPPLACRAPITYNDTAVRTDIANLKAALAGVEHEEAFIPAATPRTNIINEFYATQEEFDQAYIDALREEYRAIIDAGFLVQIDDSAFASEFGDEPDETMEQRVARAEIFVEKLNYAVKSLPADRIRFHTCYGTNIGPRTHEAPLRNIVDLLMRMNVGAYSFEASNPRHAHDWHVWEDRKLPEGKVLIPGFISHSTTLVEHPEWIADNIVNYANLVGRANLIAGADCGFSSMAMYTPEIMPEVVWAKFAALAEGARIATKRLWR